MRVLHVISGLDPVLGGPVTVLTGMAAAQAAAGLDVTVLSPWHERGTRQHDEVAAALHARGVKTRLFGPVRQRRGVHPEMTAIVRDAVAAADVVHIHAVWEEIQHAAARAAAARGAPYLFTPHGMLDPWNLSNGRWKKRLYLALRLRRDLNGAAAIHAGTPVEADGFARLRLKPPRVVEPFGLDLREFEDLPARGEFHRAHPELGDAPYVLYLGRLHRGKGLELLIPAFAQAAPSQTRLMIAGPDSANFKSELDAMIATAGVADRVLFTGMLRGRDRLAALAGAELLALPSFHENFGMAVVESLAASRPVLVSDQVQLWREITDAGVGGVCKTTVESTAAALRQWLGDPARRDAAAQRARPFALARYDWNAIARNWLRHYTQIAGRHGATNAAVSR
jgi:glycosyltransferase involved in cell wall biosynthesis